MKKVLIGVGIGCGALVLIAIIGMVAVGVWAKGKVEGVAQGSEKMQEQEKRITQLNERYAFTPPPQGQPILLEEDRLKDYFAIRAAMKPVLAEYEEKGKKFEKQPGEQANLNEGLEALGLVMEMMGTVRSKWLDQLESKKMSPQEFYAISAAVFSSGLGVEMGNWKQNERKMYEQLKAEMERQAADEANDPTSREEARQQAKEMEAKLAALPPEDAPPPESAKIHEANAELLKKYSKEVEEGASLGLEAYIGGADMGAAFQDAIEQKLPEDEGAEQ